MKIQINKIDKKLRQLRRRALGGSILKWPGNLVNAASY
jgi:hypothetical protein